MLGKCTEDASYRSSRSPVLFVLLFQLSPSPVEPLVLSIGNVV